MRAFLHCIWLLTAWFGMSASRLPAQEANAVQDPDIKTRPARIRPADLDGFEALHESRRKLIQAALDLAWDSPWLPYRVAGSSPADGGFDCSGATYFVMRKVGLDPARSAAAQMDWIKTQGRLHPVSPDAADPAHPSLANLKPGDLLFWAKNDPDGKPRIHHVALYLGTEAKDGRHVMIGSSDGRSYRGRKTNGYGVQDFKLPGAASPSKLVAYGTPPGIEPAPPDQ